VATVDGLPPAAGLDIVRAALRLDIVRAALLKSRQGLCKGSAATFNCLSSTRAMMVRPLDYGALLPGVGPFFAIIWTLFRMFKLFKSGAPQCVLNILNVLNTIREPDDATV
jgi:hypothetical protein